MSRGTKDAEKVLRRFLDCGMKRDEAGMRACLTKASQAEGKFDPNSGPPPGTEFLMGEGVEESPSTIVIPVLGKAAGEAADTPATLMMNCVMVKEPASDGAWKVDLATTMDRMMGGVIEKVAETMNAAVSSVATAVGEAFDNAFAGAGDTTSDWSSAELSPRQEELLALPAMTALPGLTKTFSEAVGSKVLVMASDELLNVGGQEGRQTLVDWFEGPLFACWADALQKAAEMLPIKGRLRAVRLEYASWFDNKTLVVDGSDLLYRMRLPESEGFYQEDMIVYCLAGVLAGLPERADPRVTGKRLILNDDEYGDLEVYRERVAPAYLRRISDVLRRPIALQVDWNNIHEPATAVRQWQRWGLNRIYGAIVLACADEALGQNLRESLTKIVLAPGFLVEGRYAKYERGILELSFPEHGGEPAGFYEQDLFAVLAGEPILAAIAEAEEDVPPFQAEDATPMSNFSMAAAASGAVGSPGTELEFAL